MRYRFLEHTADIMFEAYGKTYSEALENSAHALFSVFGEAKEKTHVDFLVSAPNLDELTVQSLADMLAYMDTHEIVFSRAKVKKFDPAANSLEIEAFGEKKRPRATVKAVTYHELMVKQDKEGWTIKVLLDV
ncbi:MAG: archease [Candidatus Micrarchaeota archaeon]|nr:archease [Candidatus Micrarchaeota archaeon]